VHRTLTSVPIRKTGPGAYPVAVIRDAVIHMNNEQPLVCDLRAMPEAEDVSLVCTNLRLVDGKKPTFIDRIDSWFAIPMHIIRFIEIPLLAVEASSILALPSGPLPDPGALTAEETEEDEAAEELLQRIRDV
jgi:hypothetical protein